MVICLSFLPLFPLFLSSLLSSYISSALSVEPSLLSPVSPVLCQSVSNLQLLRLFSSLLPLGSVSGTVSLFFYLFTLPFPSLFLHSALPLIQPVLSDPSSCISVCLSSLLTHFSHEVKFWVLITWPFLRLNSHSHAAWTWVPDTFLKPWAFSQV